MTNLKFLLVFTVQNPLIKYKYLYLFNVWIRYDYASYTYNDYAVKFKYF